MIVGNIHSSTVLVGELECCSVCWSTAWNYILFIERDWLFFRTEIIGWNSVEKNSFIYRCCMPREWLNIRYWWGIYLNWIVIWLIHLQCDWEEMIFEFVSWIHWIIEQIFGENHSYSRSFSTMLCACDVQYDMHRSSLTEFWLFDTFSSFIIDRDLNTIECHGFD